MKKESKELYERIQSETLRVLASEDCLSKTPPFTIKSLVDLAMDFYWIGWTDGCYQGLKILDGEEH